MSHIVKGKVQVAYKDKELLLKALEGVGVVVENEKLYRVGAGYTFEKYPIVLIDQNNKEHRIGDKGKKRCLGAVPGKLRLLWPLDAAGKQQGAGSLHCLPLRAAVERGRFHAVTVKQHHDGTLELEKLRKLFGNSAKAIRLVELNDEVTK
ncbi:hypothetical protein [Enterobacter cloacae complex sp. 304I2]|uniref:hypothetical protein n=1 Tax=Enterobacter cloacae complex sp. 304I2 TaxID=3395829 RepID=UPI003CF5365D